MKKKRGLEIIFKEKISRVFGYVLKQIKFNYKILYYRTPSNIVDFESANHYRIKYEGKLIPISVKDNVEEKIIDDFDGGLITRNKEVIKETFYIVNVYDKKRLRNGFTPIKDMIYLNQSIKMYNTFLKLQELEINVYGIKTDCLLVNKVNFNDLKNNFKISDNIGEYKIEKNKKLTNTKLEIIENELITFPDFKPFIKTFNDEYDTKSINNYIDENRVVFIKGIYPGTGKSQAVKNYDKDTLFIVPYNELGLQMMTEGYKTSTFNSFFGLDLTDNERINKVKFDYSAYNTICFDESYLHIPSRQKKIDKFIKEIQN